MSPPVPAPPADLRAPNTIVLRPGSLLHRVHASAFGATAFDPCRGRPTRFAPIEDAKGRCVPSLYAATSLEAALFETVFHDVAADARFMTVPKQEVEARSHTVLELTQPLVMIELRAPDLKRWGLERENLVAAPAAHWVATARWAEVIHRRFSDVDGLIWTSNRCDPDSACLFFGDRVESTALTIVSTRRGSDDDGFVEDVRRAGERAGIVLSL